MTVSKGKLKARMLEYFREIERTGEPLVVTDRGKEVLEIRPLVPKPVTAAKVLAKYRSGPGKGVSNVSEEEIMRPLPEEDWEALRDDARNPW